MVKETRENRGLFFTKRRRLCDNGHGFNTYEVHSVLFLTLGSPRVAAAAAKAQKRAELYAASLKVWLAHNKLGETQVALSRQLNITKYAVQRMCARIQKDRKDKDAP